MLRLVSTVDDDLLVCHGRTEPSSNNNNTITNKESSELSYSGSMKVTIKNKPITESPESNATLLSWAFHTFLLYIQRTKRLYELQIKAKEKLVNKKLHRYFRTWKSKVDEKKKAITEKKCETDFSDEQKIQLFVNAIVNKQKSNTSKRNSIEKPEKTHQNFEENTNPKTVIADTSLQKRLSLQKKIITEQRLRLVQQNQIIESMKLERLTEESKHGKTETFTTAKKVLDKCNNRTRSNLLQLMRAESQQSLADPPKSVYNPPVFLSRMEARAERRKERMREAKEKQRVKLEVQKQQEEAILREEQEKQKNLRLELQRKAKRIRQEQERRRIMENEKMQMVNELVNNFYKKYLLANYIWTPLVRMVESENKYIKMADDHYVTASQRKIFSIWRDFARNEIDSKIQQCTSLCNTNILWRFFGEWMYITKRTIQSYQMAWKFYTSRLRRKYLTAWYSEVLEIKVKALGTEQFVINYYDGKIKAKYFQLWGKYTKIADEVNESDRQKEKWRALVQNVVPNFCPKYRGVIMDDEF